MIKEFGKVEKNLQELLTKRPELNKLEKRREMIWEYWRVYDGLTWGLSKEMWMFRATWPDYITRALRKLLVKDKKLDTERPKREESMESFKKALSSQDQKDFNKMFGD